MIGEKKSRPIFDWAVVRPALWDSFKKLDPRHQARNPVMFVVEVGSVLTTGLWLQALCGRGEAPAGFILAVSLSSRPSGRGPATMDSAGGEGTTARRWQVALKRSARTIPAPAATPRISAMRRVVRKSR